MERNKDGFANSPLSFVCSPLPSPSFSFFFFFFFFLVASMKWKQLLAIVQRCAGSRCRWHQRREQYPPACCPKHRHGDHGQLCRRLCHVVLAAHQVCHGELVFQKKKEKRKEKRKRQNRTHAHSKSLACIRGRSMFWKVKQGIVFYHHLFRLIYLFLSIITLLISSGGYSECDPGMNMVTFPVHKF
jgi:hypothetical protein